MNRFILILVALVTYSYFKAIQLAPDHGQLAIWGTILFFVLMLSPMFLLRTHSKYFENWLFRAFSWFGYFLMAFWTTFILISIFLDGVRFVASFFINFDAYPETLEKVYISIVVLSLFLSILGLLETLRGPFVKRTKVKFNNLPNSLKELKIVQISDLHVGPTIRTKYVEKVVNIVSALNADIIVFTGDIADAKAESIAPHLEPLKNLKSKYGSYLVTGNHEYYWGVESILNEIINVGLKPLINSNEILKIGSENLLLAGVTDPVGKQMMENHLPDMESAAKSSIDSNFKILLAHRPDACIEAEEYGFDLQFSGHTHAGQFFPFSLLIGLEHKYYNGLYTHGSMQVYVNPGTGYWGPPNRLGIKAEISEITLMD